MGKLVFLLLFALSLVIFAFENTNLVHIQFLVWKSQEVPLAMVIILSAVAGAFVTFIVTLPIHHRKHRALVRKTRELQDLKESIH
jgi:uncharacterized integral membrane protein